MSTPDDDFDLDAFDKAFAKEFGDTLSHDPTPVDDAGESPAPESEPVNDGERTLIAVVLTPVADARMLARLMGLVKIDWPVFPTRTGASAATILEIDEMTALAGSMPTEAVRVAAALSQTSEFGVVLLTSQVGESEEGATGQVQAVRFVGGKEVEKLSPGVVLAGADETVDSVVFGLVAPAEVEGALNPLDVATEDDTAAPEQPRKRRWGRKPR